MKILTHNMMNKNLKEKNTGQTKAIQDDLTALL